MKKVSIVILIGFISFLWASCTEVIELDLNKGGNLKLVVDAWLDNSGRQQSISLSLSTDFYDVETPDEAENAVVTVSSGRKTYTFEEREAGEYYMNEDFDAREGETFELRIEYEDEIYTATQTMNRVAELQTVDFVLFEEFDEENHDTRANPDRLDEWDIYATFQEPSGVGDYYYFSNFLKSEGPNINLYQGEYYEDEILDGAFIDSEYVTYGYYDIGDTIVTQMFSISKDVFDYLTAVDEQTDFRGFIFDTPPANVPTNISNDGKGFFVVSSVSEIEKVLE